MSDFKNYVKKPVVIKALQMDHDFEIETLEGTMKGKAGDYYIIGTHRERYPCKKEIFEANYEAVIG